jgi:hydrogenase nickel incorporation protein HypA/HybF
MHELSIAMSILELAEEESERRGGVLIESIHIRLGPLAGVVKEALLGAYELARSDSPFPESRLVIEEVPIVVLCPQCQAERPVHSMQRFCCATCDTPVSEVIHGRELELAALELME